MTTTTTTKKMKKNKKLTHFFSVIQKIHTSNTQESIKMSPIAVSTFKVIAMWIAERIHSDELSQLVENGLYDDYVSFMKQPKAKVAKEPKEPKAKIAKEPKERKPRVKAAKKMDAEEIEDMEIAAIVAAAASEKEVSHEKPVEEKKKRGGRKPKAAAAEAELEPKAAAAEAELEPKAAAAEAELEPKAAPEKKTRGKKKIEDKQATPVLQEATPELQEEVAEAPVAEAPPKKKGGRKQKASVVEPEPEPVVVALEEAIEAEAQDNEDEDAIEVTPIVIDDIEYLIDGDKNIYDTESNIVGTFNEETNSINFI